MANLCLSILVLSCFQIVFANVCLKEYQAHESCDECIRCGGSWCHQMEEDGHCMRAPHDEWCPAGKEKLPSIRPRNDDGGTDVSPSYSEKTLFPGISNELTLTYVSKTELRETWIIHNSTQNKHLHLKTMTHECLDSKDSKKCTLKIEVTTLPDFCSRVGSTNEFVYVVVSLTGADKHLEAAVKYHVPCACECSSKTVKKSEKCHGNGDLTCGACKCYSGTIGDDCKCPEKRGDVPCADSSNDKTCSGNGYCGPCDVCICYPDRDGSQYFDPENFCADICMVTRDCDACLRNGTVGECGDCHHMMTVHQYNETVSEERDELNRRVWARCNEPVDQCHLEYVAMREPDNSIHVMVIKSCNDVLTPAAVAIATKVPLILGVLGILAAVAAVGGVMLWKHMNAVPPLPLTDPKYENIDAEDCIGENPLYKPPTSQFKNPTYGKW